MGIKIPEYIRLTMIDRWVSGETRDNIAAELQLGEGTVSNVIKEWQNRIGVFDANNLRMLGLALKKAGISPIQCVYGLRITNILKQLGIDEDHLFDFLTKVYNKSKEQKLLPADLVRLVQVINEYPEINSLNEIPKNINKRRQEKIKLDAEIYYKKLELRKLDQEIKSKKKEIQDIQDDLDSSRKEMQDEKKDFLLFRNVKEELNKHGIAIHILDPLIDVIKIFKDMHFRPLTILSKFSDINAYRDLIENKDIEIEQRELHIQDLKDISDNYEMKITSNEPIVHSLNQLEYLGFSASDIKNLHLIFSKISKKYGLNKNEIKIRFFRCINYYFNNLLPLQQGIFEKQNEISILDSEISSRRKMLESQPIVFSILQYLISAGLNEHDILMALKIFITDMSNNMPYGDRTYLERLSKDLNKYPTVRDTLEVLNNKILLKQSHIDKLALFRSNLEYFLLSLVLTTIYFYFPILFNAKWGLIQKNLKILLILNLNYLPILLYILNKDNKKKHIRSKFIQNRTEQQQQQQKITREKKRTAKKDKNNKSN
jgi:hypothetical protein